MPSELNLSQQQVQDIAEKITASKLSQEDKALLVSALYMANSRVEEAIKILENIINNGSQNKGIYRILGDIYLCTNQYQLASSSYKKVLDLSKNHPLCVERLATKAGLAQIEARSRIEVETKRLYQELENEFNNLASDRQESAIQLAIRNLSSSDQQLVSLLTSLTTDCEVAQCNNVSKGKRIKSSDWGICITCIPR